jgi:hypothetical protein
MIRTSLIALALTLLVLPGCDTNEAQDEFFLQSELPPDDYTPTNEAGEIVGPVDADDWRTAPAFQGSVEVVPAAPNPVGRDGFVTIVVQDTFDDIITGGVYASGFDDNGRFVRLAVDEGNGPFYALTFDPSLLRLVGGDAARLYRVRIFTNDSRLISYGDILVR